MSESVHKLQSWVQLWAITEAALPKHIQTLLPNSEPPFRGLLSVQKALASQIPED